MGRQDYVSSCYPSLGSGQANGDFCLFTIQHRKEENNAHEPRTRPAITVVFNFVATHTSFLFGLIDSLRLLSRAWNSQPLSSSETDQTAWESRSFLGHASSGFHLLLGLTRWLQLLVRSSWSDALVKYVNAVSRNSGGVNYSLECPEILQVFCVVLTYRTVHFFFFGLFTYW